MQTSCLLQDNNGVIGLLEPMKKCTLPVQIPLDKTVIKIASGKSCVCISLIKSDYLTIDTDYLRSSFKGNDHLVMLTLNGDIYTCGCGEQGQLGRVPERFANRGGRKGLSRFCFFANRVFLKPVMFLFLILFLSSFMTVRLLEPQMVMIKPRGKVHFVDVFCGAYFTFVLSEDGHVYGFGLSNYHQLGRSYMSVSNAHQQNLTH